jgi:hypothetical protein
VSKKWPFKNRTVKFLSGHCNPNSSSFSHDGLNAALKACYSNYERNLINFGFDSALFDLHSLAILIREILVRYLSQDLNEG